jgi:hypothetical protein
MYALTGPAWTEAPIPRLGCLSPLALLGLPSGRLVATCSYYPFLVRLTVDGPPGVEHAIPLGFDGLTARGEDDVFAINTASGAIAHYRGGPWGERGWQERWTVPDALGLGTDGRDVFAVGKGGLAVRLSGEGWVREATGTTASLFAVWGSSEGLFVVGLDGIALFRDAAGWHPLPTGTSGSLAAVRGAGPDVVAVGRDGLVLRLERE